MEKQYFTSQPDLWKGLHLLAMKYRNMNVFQRLIFRIRSRIYKPKLNYIDLQILCDTTTIQENLNREDMSYNDLIKKEFKNAK